ncbi:hypothetical protein BDP27DRAFT_1428701 [Rhodocollybia butyracea]|uniref:Uncharacterized protein n=1 Tax=Rhodocollybia butyracea TaxID=206335 RepID=A0A9P5PA00_9AGAR|nr:hypothetical protein BDP27DRAFT_1432884 [Rhodocollybia butyracea]KAF9061649.1 hypothetical protein BDP27DRAFT_1428701 [Rhodocollybia butyracea]
MSDFIVAPAPWHLKARTWVFAVSSEAGSKDANNLPAGWAAPWQADALAAGGEFIGGPAVVMLVQYSDTPVGRYDELGYFPGRWRYADGSIGFRMSIMLVSSKDSTWNGRRNWNIPKQVASFKYESLSNGSWSLSVSQISHDHSLSDPLFQVTINPISLISRLPIPFNSRWFGKILSFAQPPLPQGSQPEEIGTEKTDDKLWAFFKPKMSGWMYLMKVVPEMNRENITIPTGEAKGSRKVVGDGVSFPAVVPTGLGVYVEDMQIELGPAIWKDV